MSFVARRYGSAGLIPDQEVVAAWPDPSFSIAPKESGLRLRSEVALVVGVSDDVATLCKEAASLADVGFVRVSQGIAACRAISDTRPTVVALAATLWRDERNAIIEAALACGATVIELPPFAPPSWVARQLVQAVMSAPDLSATG